MAASPDFRPYVDLTVFDRSVAGLVDRVLLDAATKLPGWVPREGNTEMVLTEAMALQIAEVVYAINRLPSVIVEILLRLFGATRSPGTAPSATATFFLSDNAGHTVPAGTRVRLDLGDDAPVVFTTDVNLVVPAAASQGTVAITAASLTAVANGIAVGTDLELLDGVTFVNSVELATAVSGGSDPEDAAAFLDRAAQTLRRLTDSLVLPAHFTAAALDDVRVVRATTIDNLDPAVGPAGSNLGHVTTVVAGGGGAALSGSVMAEIEAVLEGKALANLDVHVAAPTITAVAVTATVRRLAGFADAEVQANVVAALEAFLNPDTWAWGATVRRNDLIAVIEGVTGVDYLEAGHPTAPAADVPLAGAGPLADAGVLTITITAPP